MAGVGVLSLEHKHMLREGEHVWNIIKMERVLQTGFLKVERSFYLSSHDVTRSLLDAGDYIILCVCVSRFISQMILPQDVCQTLRMDCLLQS